MPPTCLSALSLNQHSHTRTHKETIIGWQSIRIDRTLVIVYPMVDFARISAIQWFDILL